MVVCVGTSNDCQCVPFAVKPRVPSFLACLSWRYIFWMISRVRLRRSTPRTHWIMLGALTDFFLALEDVQRVVDSGAKNYYLLFKRVHKRENKKKTKKCSTWKKSLQVIEFLPSRWMFNCGAIDVVAQRCCCIHIVDVVFTSCFCRPLRRRRRSRRGAFFFSFSLVFCCVVSCRRFSSCVLVQAVVSVDVGVHI